MSVARNRKVLALQSQLEARILDEQVIISSFHVIPGIFLIH